MSESPKTVYGDAGVGMTHEASVTEAANAAMETGARAFRWMPISTGTRVVALAIGGLGVVLLVVGWLCSGRWWADKFNATEIFNGLAENLLAVTVVVFLVDGIDRARKWKWLNRQPWGQRVLKRLGLDQKEVT